MKFNITTLIVFVFVFIFAFTLDAKEFDFSEHPNVKELTAKTLDSFISSSKPTVIYYYGKNKDSDKVMTYFLKKSDEYLDDGNDQINFGIINLDTEIKVRITHLVDSTPTIIYYNKKGTEVSEWLGPKSKKTLEKFINNPLMVPPPSKGPGSWKEIESQVAHLNSRNFSSFIANHPDGVLVMFFTPQCGHCTKMKPAYASASKIVIDKDIGRLAAVDCSESKKICETQSFKIEGFPTIYYFKNGKTPTQYGGDRSVDDLVSFVTQQSSPSSPPSSGGSKNKKVKNEL